MIHTILLNHKLKQQQQQFGFIHLWDSESQLGHDSRLRRWWVSNLRREKKKKNITNHYFQMVKNYGRIWSHFLSKHLLGTLLKRVLNLLTAFELSQTTFNYLTKHCKVSQVFSTRSASSTGLCPKVVPSLAHAWKVNLWPKNMGSLYWKSAWEWTD